MRIHWNNSTEHIQQQPTSPRIRSSAATHSSKTHRSTMTLIVRKSLPKLRVKTWILKLASLMLTMKCYRRSKRVSLSVMAISQAKSITFQHKASLIKIAIEKPKFYWGGKSTKRTLLARVISYSWICSLTFKQRDFKSIKLSVFASINLNSSQFRLWNLFRHPKHQMRNCWKYIGSLCWRSCTHIHLIHPKPQSKTTCASISKICQRKYSINLWRRWYQKRKKRVILHKLTTASLKFS